MTGIFNSIQLLYRKLEFFLSSVHEFPFGRTMFVHYSYTHSLASDTHSPQYIELDIWRRSLEQLNMNVKVLPNGIPRSKLASLLAHASI